MTPNLAEIVTLAWAVALVCVLLVVSYCFHGQD